MGQALTPSTAEAANKEAALVFPPWVNIWLFKLEMNKF